MLELFDLHALVDGAAGDAELVALKPFIRSAMSMSSVRNDLKRAAEMMAACKALSGRVRDLVAQGNRFERSEAATIQALFAQAVLLYARATHSQGKGRNKLQITDHLDPKYRALHDRTTGLRDHYLAHFSDATGWEQHRVVLALDLEDNKMALSYPYSGAYIRPQGAEDLEQLLAAALPIADKVFGKASERLNLALNNLFDTRPDFLAALRGAGFDPTSFFDADELQPYLDGIGKLDPDPITEPRLA